MAKFFYFKIAIRDVILKARLHVHILCFCFFVFFCNGSLKWTYCSCSCYWSRCLPQVMTEQLCDKVQATFWPFFSFSACNTHTGTQNNTYTWFIFGFVAAVHGLCVWKNVAAWEPCGNHTRLPPAHLRVMGKTVTKNNRERSHPVLTSTTLMFSLNLAHYFWIQKLHRKY